MPRPKLWQSFVHVLPGCEYTDDGRIRDRSRNELADTHRRFRYITRIQFLALEWLGEPPVEKCYCCDFQVPHRVIYLDGNRTNIGRGNLKYDVDTMAIREHESRHLEILLRAAPPRRQPFRWEHEGPSVKQPVKTDRAPGIAFAGSDGPCGNLNILD